MVDSSLLFDVISSHVSFFGLLWKSPAAESPPPVSHQRESAESPLAELGPGNCIGRKGISAELAHAAHAMDKAKLGSASVRMRSCMYTHICKTHAVHATWT